MGLSPYDKKQYRESKRRRRQALLQSETGYIVPYRRSKRLLIIAVVILSVIVVAVAGVFAVLHFTCGTGEESAGEAVTLSEREALAVVNRVHPLAEDEEPPLKIFREVPVHAAVYGELEKLFQKAEEEKVALTLSEGFVSYGEQKKRYQQNLDAFLADKSYTPVRAQAAAQRVVPDAGCCEAQTGLLLRFDVSNPQTKAFLERECIHCGFILRYPEGKDDLTHINPDASLYRYVGRENAEKMRAFDMCLEEYAEYRNVY